MEKSEAAAIFWEGIGAHGRDQYLVEIGANQEYVNYQWQEIPKPIRQALSRTMNQRQGRGVPEPKTKILPALARIGVGIAGRVAGAVAGADDNEEEEKEKGLFTSFILMSDRTNTDIMTVNKYIDMSDVDQFHTGDKVIFVGGEGIISNLTSKYATVVKSDSTSHVVHVKSLLKTEDIIYTDKNQMTTWNGLNLIEKYMLCDCIKASRDFANKMWSELPQEFRTLIKEKYGKPKKKSTVTQDEVNDFLDGLRESGVTNMFGATPYIVSEFGCTQQEARKFLVNWMETFSTRHPISESEKAKKKSTAPLTQDEVFAYLDEFHRKLFEQGEYRYYDVPELRAEDILSFLNLSQQEVTKLILAWQKSRGKNFSIVEHVGGKYREKGIEASPWDDLSEIRCPRCGDKYKLWLIYDNDVLEEVRCRNCHWSSSDNDALKSKKKGNEAHYICEICGAFNSKKKGNTLDKLDECPLCDGKLVKLIDLTNENAIVRTGVACTRCHWNSIDYHAPKSKKNDNDRCPACGSYKIDFKNNKPSKCYDCGWESLLKSTIEKMKAEPINVWSVKRYFMMYSKFPQMTENDEIIFLDFCKSEVADCIEAYQKCVSFQGSHSKDAREMMIEIEDAEKMYFAFQDHIVDTKARRVGVEKAIEKIKFTKEDHDLYPFCPHCNKKFENEIDFDNHMRYEEEIMGHE